MKKDKWIYTWLIYVVGLSCMIYGLMHANHDVVRYWIGIVGSLICFGIYFFRRIRYIRNNNA
jgi:uncharacterized membrane protein